MLDVSKYIMFHALLFVVLIILNFKKVISCYPLNLIV